VEEQKEDWFLEQKTLTRRTYSDHENLLSMLAPPRPLVGAPAADMKSVLGCYSDAYASRTFERSENPYRPTRQLTQKKAGQCVSSHLTVSLVLLGWFGLWYGGLVSHVTLMGHVVFSSCIASRRIQPFLRDRFNSR